METEERVRAAELAHKQSERQRRSEAAVAQERERKLQEEAAVLVACLLYTSPSPRD